MSLAGEFFEDWNFVAPFVSCPKANEKSSEGETKVERAARKDGDESQAARTYVRRVLFLPLPLSLSS